MGRPRLSPEEHELRGNEPRYAPGGESAHVGSLPRPPKFLSPEGRKKFRSMVKQLAERRTVTAGDADLISIYCTTWERWQDALLKIREQGVVATYQRLGANGNAVNVEKTNLHWSIAKECERSMLSILSRLGLTPKDRDSVKPTTPATKKNEPVEGRVEWLKLELAKQQALEAAAPQEPGEAEPEHEDVLEDFDETAFGV